ncbi:MAG: hypothetical protein GFH27_549297n11 [Chloroflexi bacterium AL-W]|nr:hypothetical protein [Chloroflexi bacterium AL-N1]NOK68537.1 hypothetical protein [Chloroflexi bacterium AL-N10]NOK76023.1 hypothetical protein [Chloroflexi bacterium AL-N5]NOK82494.1 hypothetical protein [Chloroflexi bacterium AL-W]NOK92806.1 hypothetical protein [Chloroflexi bacterium AL-N15]
MNIGKAISYVFEDERWISKVLLGGLIAAIPILNFAAIGYMIKTARNVAYGNPRPLPEWGEDFGDTFMLGFHGFVISRCMHSPSSLLRFSSVACWEHLLVRMEAKRQRKPLLSYGTVYFFLCLPLVCISHGCLSMLPMLVTLCLITP